MEGGGGGGGVGEGDRPKDRSGKGRIKLKKVAQRHSKVNGSRALDIAEFQREAEYLSVRPSKTEK